MVKATRFSAVLLGLTALGLCASSVPAFAEVQDVKVGGDVTTRAFVRTNLDLQDGGLDGTASTLDDHDRFIQLTTGLNVAANLTENVAAGLRLANETTYGAKAAAGSDFAVSQAWVRLKELFYSPLTVTLGRQPIWWGRGFIIGSGLLPNIRAATAGDLHGSIAADEYTDFTAVDAMRAQLDFQGAAAVDLPLLLDFVYIKQAEGTVGIADDVNIVGVNAGTKLDAAEFETYFVNKRDRSDISATLQPAGYIENHGSVNTLGVRGSAAPIEGSSVFGELAYQFGTRVTDPAGILSAGDRHQAWAANFGAEFGAKDVPTSPMLGGEWIWYSGSDVEGATAGWNSILPGYFRTALRQFQSTGFYVPTQTCVVAGTTSAANCTGSDTNQHELALYGSMTPLEDLTIAPRLSWFILDNGVIPIAGSKRRSFAGTEWDTQVTYNYTSDVQFGVLYAAFFPGSVYRTPSDAVAQELVTTVGVKF